MFTYAATCPRRRGSARKAMCIRTSRLVIAVICGLTVSGCSRIGLCTEDQIDMVVSPSGRYQMEIIGKDCVGSSPVQEVFLRRAQGVMKGRTAVAIFDASNPDKPVRLSVRWRGESYLVINARGAKVWYFQPHWHDVRITER